MQVKRHDADYDPYQKFYKSEVKQDIATVRQAIIDFELSTRKDKIAFCAFILFKKLKT